MTKGETFQEKIKADPKATVVVYFAGPEKRRVSAIYSGGEFIITADTTSWKDGNYIWEAWATVGDIKTLLARKTLILEQSAVDMVDGTDVRSDARKAVKFLREMLSGGASLEACEYKINNRALKRYSIPELLQLLSVWERKLAVEKRRAKGMSELGPRITFRI